MTVTSRTSLLVFLVLGTAGCYVHTRAHMISPVIPRPRLCQAAVAFFDTRTDVTNRYVEVASLSVWWPRDMVATVAAIERAERSKAAKLGANGIIRGRLVQADSLHQPRYIDNVSGFAVFIPGDSARTIDACAPTARADRKSVV